MGFWGNIRSFFGASDMPNVPSDPGIQFFEYNGETQWINVCGTDALKNVYRKCSALSTIIGNKAEIFSSGNLEVLNANTENYVRGKHKEWERLLMQPNPIQNQTQFLKQIYTYVQLRGWCYVLKDYRIGFSDELPYQMWVLPSWFITFDDRRVPLFLLKKEDLNKGVYFEYGGVKTPLKPENLMLFTDTTDIYDERTWMPESRVTLLEYPITTIMSAAEAEVTMIQKRGAIGILSNDTHDSVGTIAMTEGEKEALQGEFQNKYGLTRSQAQIIVTDSAVKWQSMTFKTSELLLQESYVKAYKDIAGQYNYPFNLTPHSTNSTYENVKTDDRRVYQSAIIPESKSLMQQLNAGLNTDKFNVLIKIDYSNVPALQQSEEERGNGIKAVNEALKIEWDNGLITRNDWLLAIGKDIINKPEFNMYKFEIEDQKTEEEFQRELSLPLQPVQLNKN